jgi:arsenate reductase (thioredoxin)
MDRYLGMYKALADEIRLRLVRIMLQTPVSLCLAELVDIVRRPQYAVSRAMSRLVQAGLVHEERHGKMRCYRCAPEGFAGRVLASVRAIPADDGEWVHDRDRLRWRLDLRQNGRCVVTYTAGYSPREYLQAEEQMEGTEKKRVLVVCVHNTARSQIAEAYIRQFGGDLFSVESAGLEPGTLNQTVVQAMAEDGIDISHKVPQSVVDLYRAGRTYSYVITVCSREAEENCPIFPGPVRRLSWPFPDPSQFTGSEEEILQQTIEVRNVIREAVKQFVTHYRAEHGQEAIHEQ